MSSHTRSHPRFVYFDLGNVLLHFNHEIACRQVAKLANRDPAEVRRVLFDGDLQFAYERGELSDADFHAAICRELDHELELTNLQVAVSDIFCLNHAIFPLLSGLYRSGIPLGILSNTCSAHWEFIRRQRYQMLFDFFDVEILSYKVGSMKPDPTIYAAAVEQAGVSPSEIFFTDDKPENILGATEAGFDAVLFENPIQLGRELISRGFTI